MAKEKGCVCLNQILIFLGEDKHLNILISLFLRNYQVGGNEGEGNRRN